jgi:16S rRNA (adenine1518-N6/adenine1519-N6)-dimethyltransferase
VVTGVDRRAQRPPEDGVSTDDTGSEGRDAAAGELRNATARELREATRAGLRELGVRPSRDRGQNFLVDPRFLGAVEQAAGLARDDVVLEVGGGLGVLSEQLAPRVAHLHVVEVDRALGRALDALLAPFQNTTLHLADAVRLDFGALEPRPTKLVANLPYGVAATVILKTLEELPGVGLLVAMAQREVAERLAAAPGSRTYGATSVLTQLSCDVRIDRRVPRSAFHPAPGVDSAIVVLSRRRQGPSPAVRTLVRHAFAHRRKTLAGSLALAAGAGADTRSRAREALVSIGHPPDERAERLAPQELEALAGALEAGATSDRGGDAGADGGAAGDSGAGGRPPAGSSAR